MNSKIIRTVDVRGRRVTVKQAGLADRMTHIPTGGEASLGFLQGADLPRVAALDDPD